MNDGPLALASPPGTAPNGGVPGEPPHVQLGDHSYAVYAQRHAYLQRKLGKLVSGLASADLSGDILGFLGERSYAVLKAFVPRLMPEYEFMGFANEDSYKRFQDGDEDAYDPEHDRSPTVPEQREALRVAVEVNGLDLLKHLGKVVDLGLLRAFISKGMADAMESRLLQNSSATSTDGPSTTSGTTAPTSSAKPDSPSPASTGS